MKYRGSMKTDSCSKVGSRSATLRSEIRRSIKRGERQDSLRAAEYDATDSHDAAETEGFLAFRRGEGYNSGMGETWCLGWSRAQDLHEAQVSLRGVTAAVLPVPTATENHPRKSMLAPSGVREP